MYSIRFNDANDIVFLMKNIAGYLECDIVLLIIERKKFSMN